MKRSLGQNTFFVYFHYFLKVCNKPQGHFCPSSNINPPYYRNPVLYDFLILYSMNHIIYLTVTHDCRAAIHEHFIKENPKVPFVNEHFMKEIIQE
jgi:hypothetical protein